LTAARARVRACPACTRTRARVRARGAFVLVRVVRAGARACRARVFSGRTVGGAAGPRCPALERPSRNPRSPTACGIFSGAPGWARHHRGVHSHLSRTRMSQSSLPPSPNQNTPGHPVTLDATKPPLSGHGSVARRPSATAHRRRAGVPPSKRAPPVQHPPQHLPGRGPRRQPRPRGSPGPRSPAAQAPRRRRLRLRDRRPRVGPRPRLAAP